MTQRMYHADGVRVSNEELAARLKGEYDSATALLLSQNEGFLTAEALKLCGQYSLPNVADDLKQEGALALLAVAKTYDPSNGAKLLTYAASAIRAAMLDYIAKSALPVRLPPSRYHQLRRVTYLCAGTPGETTDDKLIALICEKENVSEEVGHSLLLDCRSIFGAVSLDDPAVSITWGGDPARAYDAFMWKKLLLQLMEQVLTARELTVVRYHLGLGQPRDREMTFEELALRLNYNGPSAAEKAFQRAVKKLRDSLNSGDYGVWSDASRAIRRARREAQKQQGYVPPQVGWWEF